MYFWYKIFTYFFYPIAPLYLYFRKLKKKEDPIRYKEKLSKIETYRGEGFLIWFHVASVGEAMSILPLVDKCLEEEKINKILVTSITLSSGKILEKKFKNNTKVVHQYLPLDIEILVDKFLNHWKPNLSIFIDSEVWPNLILKTNERKIPLLLINARITKKSYKRWKLVLNFAKKIFSKFSICIVSNEESKNFLNDLGAKNIINCGNLKFSNRKTELAEKFDNVFLNKIKNRNLWCAASTHADEEIICANSHKKIKENYNNILTIIIPRHIDRVKKIYEHLSKMNLKILLSNQISELNDKTDIILVNSYGEASKFYNISKCVFVGKSLVKSLINDSGQNPIEPSRLGCKILHGPFTSNFFEIYNYLKTLGVATIVNNSYDLSLAVTKVLKENKEKNYEIGKKIENYGQTVLNNVLVELRKYI